VRDSSPVSDQPFLYGLSLAGAYRDVGLLLKYIEKLGSLGFDEEDF
jgi:hypothetical protein